jgi:hypothetical protein
MTEINEELKQEFFDLIDKHFPKGKCKERGAAMVLVAEALMFTTTYTATQCLLAQKAELESFDPMFKGDHSKCLDPRSCIGYQNAQSDFDNEKEIRLTELKRELENGRKV